MTDPRIQIEVVGVEGMDRAMAHLRRSRDALLLAPRPVVMEAGMILRDALRKAAPRSATRQGSVRSKHMADTIDFRVAGSPVGYLATFTADPIARFVIEGTRPHDIWAGIYTGGSSSKALHFFAGGREIFTPFVHHPGTRANDFRKKAWRDARGAVMALLRSTGNSVIRGEVIRTFGVGI